MPPEDTTKTQLESIDWFIWFKHFSALIPNSSHVSVKENLRDPKNDNVLIGSKKNDERLPLLLSTLYVKTI